MPIRIALVRSLNATLSLFLLFAPVYNASNPINCNVTTVDSTNNTFHVDAVLVNAKYARLLMRSRTNSVSITATITGG